MHGVTIVTAVRKHISSVQQNFTSLSLNFISLYTKYLMYFLFALNVSRFSSHHCKQIPFLSMRTNLQQMPFLPAKSSFLVSFLLHKSKVKSILKSSNPATCFSPLAKLQNIFGLVQTRPFQSICNPNKTEYNYFVFQNFQTVVPPIPIFEKLNDTYSQGEV